MRRLTFSIFLIAAALTSFLRPQGAFADQSDSIALRVTVLDSSSVTPRIIRPDGGEIIGDSYSIEWRRAYDSN